MRRLILFAVIAILPLSLSAASRQWVGGGADSLWTNPANWQNGIAPVAGDDLTFAGITNLNTVNDFPADTTFRSITILAGFTLSGNRIIVTHGISSQATVALDTILGASQTYSAPCCATATFAGNIDLNGYTLTLRGTPQSGIPNTGASGTVDVTGTIHGSGAVVQTGRRVRLHADNTYAGTTQAEALVVFHDHGLGVADGTTANGTEIIGGLHLTDVEIGNEALTMMNTGAQLIGSGTASVDGPISGGANIRFLSDSGGNLSLNGPISGGVINLTQNASSGSIIFNNASSSFTSLETIEPVRVVVGVDGGLPSTAELRFLWNGAFLDMNNRTTTVRSYYTPPGTFTTFAAGSKPLVVTENANLHGPLTLTDAFDGVTGQSYTIIRTDSTMPVSGQFDGLPEGGSFTLRGQTYYITYKGGDGNDVVLTAGAAPPTPTTTTLASSNNPSDEGEPVTFTATVGTSSGTPTGTVTFYDNGVTVFTTALNGASQAQFTTASLSTGTHPITATYNGSGTHAGSASNVVTQVVTDVQSSISIDDTSVVEGNSFATFEVMLTPASSGTVTVQYATMNGTASAGSDYEPTTGTLTFLAGQTEKTIQVPIVDDSTFESEETFRVQLSNPTGDATLQRGEGVGTIVDDDVSFVTTTHEYAKIGNRSLLLDLTVPLEGAGPFPVIVWIHPGGWRSGSRVPSPALREVARGYAVASIDYRPSTEAVWPAQIADVKGAVRWLRANASSLQLHPLRIGAWGHEAGAHLAAMLGTAPNAFDDPAHGNMQFSSRVFAVVEWGGATNLLRMNATALPCSTIDHNSGTSRESQLLGCTLPSCTEKAAEASPVTWVSPIDAAFLIAHGQQDCSVPPAQALELYNALRDSGGDASLQLVNGVGGHTDEYWSSEDALSQVDIFFDTKLKDGPLPGRTRAVRH